MTEWEFLKEVAEASDCLILLDINNIYVNAFNHHFNQVTYIQNIPKERVYQHHLAGHTNLGNCIVDTHGEAIISSVWDLYKQAVHYFGPVSTMIERDDNIPPLDVLLEELGRARQISQSVLKQNEAQLQNLT